MEIQIISKLSLSRQVVIILPKRGVMNNRGCLFSEHQNSNIDPCRSGLPISAHVIHSIKIAQVPRANKNQSSACEILNFLWRYGITSSAQHTLYTVETIHTLYVYTPADAFHKRETTLALCSVGRISVVGGNESKNN